MEKKIFSMKVSMTQHIDTCHHIYDGPGSLSHDFKIWPITFQGSGPSRPIVVKKSHCNKNIHLTASLKTPQNRKCMLVVNTVKPVLSSPSKKLEDLKVLRRSPDLCNNVKIGQGQL